MTTYFHNIRKFYEYMKLGIIEEVLNNQKSLDKLIYYMPHRAIIRNDSGMTKTRMVFDTSSSDEGKLSLNDC